MPTPTYDLIASNVLSSATASLTFSSISGSYRDLVLICNVVAATANQAFPRLRFNSDSGTNYSYVGMTGTGAAPVSNTSSAENAIQLYDAGPSATTTDRAIYLVNIMDYSATDKHKTCVTRANRATGSGAGTAAIMARWANTNAITSIEVTTGANNMDIGSTFYLYGIAS